jgi:hypothetical protein
MYYFSVFLFSNDLAWKLWLERMHGQSSKLFYGVFEERKHPFQLRILLYA